MPNEVKRKIEEAALRKGLMRLNKAAVCRDAGVLQRDLEYAMRGLLRLPSVRAKLAGWCGLSVADLFGGDAQPPAATPPQP
jgi:hypothetical protein